MTTTIAAMTKDNVLKSPGAQPENKTGDAAPGTVTAGGELAKANIVRAVTESLTAAGVGIAATAGRGSST